MRVDILAFPVMLLQYTPITMAVYDISINLTVKCWSIMIMIR